MDSHESLPPASISSRPVASVRPSLEELNSRFAERLPGAAVLVDDESHLHSGHAGAAGGAGHYRVKVVWAHFSGLSTVARHRLVYDAVADWMPHRVHALSITAVEQAVPPKSLEAVDP